MSTFNGTRCLAPPVIMLIASTFAVGQEDGVEFQAPLSWVQHLIQVAFPELKGRECRLSLTVATELDHDWRGSGLVLFEVYRAESAERVPPILKGRFNAIPGFESVSLGGPLLADPALQAAKREAESHPEWTEADLLNVLRRAGAQYPGDRKADFLQHLDLPRFAPLLGTIKDAEVDFLGRGPRALPPTQQLVALQWVVRVRTLDKTSGPRRYILAFEPMHGRLTNLVTDETKH